MPFRHQHKIVVVGDEFESDDGAVRSEVLMVMTPPPPPVLVAILDNSVRLPYPNSQPVTNVSARPQGGDPCPPLITLVQPMPPHAARGCP